MHLISFIFGLLVGSFLNVCIYRLPRQETIVKGSSYCPHCQTELAPKDLVPLFSYVLLKGQCGYCQHKIHYRYPLVEFSTGLIFVLTFVKFSLTPLLWKYLFILSLLLVISGIDLDWQIIPNKLVIVLLGWGLLWQILFPEITWLQALLGALLGGGLLLLIALISPGGMGGGDIKLMFASGFILGGPLTLLALFLGFVIGAVIGVFLLLTGRKKRKEPIPFGPFLALGILIAVFWGDVLIHSYLNLWAF